jgi:hypothetical protein
MYFLVNWNVSNLDVKIRIKCKMKMMVINVDWIEPFISKFHFLKFLEVRLNIWHNFEILDPYWYSSFIFASLRWNDSKVFAPKWGFSIIDDNNNQKLWKIQPSIGTCFEVDQNFVLQKHMLVCFMTSRALSSRQRNFFYAVLVNCGVICAPKVSIYFIHSFTFL